MVGGFGFSVLWWWFFEFGEFLCGFLECVFGAFEFFLEFFAFCVVGVGVLCEGFSYV